VPLVKPHRRAKNGVDQGDRPSSKGGGEAVDNPTLRVVSAGNGNAVPELLAGGSCGEKKEVGVRADKPERCVQVKIGGCRTGKQSGKTPVLKKEAGVGNIRTGHHCFPKKHKTDAARGAKEPGTQDAKKMFETERPSNQ